MRKLILLAAFLSGAIIALAQPYEIRRIKKELADHPQQDTFRVNRLSDLASNSPGHSKETFSSS